MQAGCRIMGFWVDFWAVDEACACNWLAMKLARRRAE